MTSLELETKLNEEFTYLREFMLSVMPTSTVDNVDRKLRSMRVAVNRAINDRLATVREEWSTRPNLSLGAVITTCQYARLVGTAAEPVPGGYWVPREELDSLRDNAVDALIALGISR